MTLLRDVFLRKELSFMKNNLLQVKWLLRDEITSFRWEAEPLTEHVLELVSQHVQRSERKNGCQLHVMPLTFVNNSYPLGFEKFKEVRECEGDRQLMNRIKVISSGSLWNSITRFYDIEKIAEIQKLISGRIPPEGGG